MPQGASPVQFELHLVNLDLPVAAVLHFTIMVVFVIQETNAFITIILWD